MPDDVTTTQGNTLTTAEIKITRSYWQYVWALDSEVQELQNIYNKHFGIYADKQLSDTDREKIMSTRSNLLNLQDHKYLDQKDPQGYKVETTEYKNLRRNIYVMHYNLIYDNEPYYTFNDTVNFEAIGYTQDIVNRAINETGDSTPNHTLDDADHATITSAKEQSKGLRDKIENNIIYHKLWLIQKFYFGIARLQTAFNDDLLASAVLNWAVIAGLLYLHAGILSFTPVSTIVLVGVIFCAIPLISSLYYIKINPIINGIKTDDNSDNEDKSNRSWAAIGLYATTIASSAFFLMAVISNIAYSSFLTTSATSLMVLPVSLWGCFALATVSLLMLYSYSYKYSDGKMFDTPTSVEKDNLNCCGVKYEFKKTSEILLSNIKTITATAYSAIEPAIKAIGANLKNNEQIQQLTYGAQSVARSAITLGTSQRPALLGTRTTDREPLTENSANGATANI